MINYTYRDVNFKENAVLRLALTKIVGIGQSRANYLCNFIGLAPYIRVNEVNSYFFFVLIELIKQYYGTDLLLKRMRENRLRVFLSFKSFKSIRFSAGLPIRGQHTHTNAKTTRHLKTLNSRNN